MSKFILIEDKDGKPVKWNPPKDDHMIHLGKGQMTHINRKTRRKLNAKRPKNPK